MHVELNKLREYVGRPLLCVTHSDRPLEEPSCELNYLEKRYALPSRLPAKQPFGTLLPAHSAYLGEVTIYDIGDAGGRSPDLVCAFRPDYKPQHCIWHDDRVWVLGVDHLEIYDADLTSVQKVRDPWLAGSHTIAPDGRGGLLVSCSASDSILRIDAESLMVDQALRLPETLYGFNYPLARQDSVVDHYIVNDLQVAHVNCAWPWRDGVLTSSLIHGAIGWFSSQGEYWELLRGFVGCHGARVRSDVEELFFCDSCAGMVVFIDTRGQITRRVSTGSRWLHDAIQICGDLFAAAVFDRNEVLLLDVNGREVVGRIPCGRRGGPQFLAFGGRPEAGSRVPDAAVEASGPPHRGGTPGGSDRDGVIAELRRQRTELINGRDALAASCAEQLSARDEASAALREEARSAVSTRDALIAELQDRLGQEVGARAATIRAQQDQLEQMTADHGAGMAALRTERDQLVSDRDAISRDLRREIDRLHHEIDDLHRDIAFMTRGWRRWVVSPRDKP